MCCGISSYLFIVSGSTIKFDPLAMARRSPCCGLTVRAQVPWRLLKQCDQLLLCPGRRGGHGTLSSAVSSHLMSWSSGLLLLRLQLAFTLLYNISVRMSVHIYAYFMHLMVNDSKEDALTKIYI